MLLSLDTNGPLYLQVYRALRQAILNGELAPGSRLPATRRIASELAVSRNVVLLAYEQLGAEGYVEGRVGSGTYVASQLPDALLVTPANASRLSSLADADPPLSAYARRALRVRSADTTAAATPAPRYDFRFGEVLMDRSGVSVWRRLLSRHANRPSLRDLAAEGYAPLRRAVADYVFRARAISCDAEQVIVVNGTQQALDLIARVFLDPGDKVVIEEPHYPGAREVFLAAGAELATCPVDEDGLQVERLEEVGAGARLVYVTPSHQFPTGAVMPLARRLALLDWARRAGAYVVEDDYDSEFRYTGRPVEAVHALDRSGRTLYIGTFSKILFPSLRLGYLVVPEHLLQPFVATKHLADRHTALLNQAVLADFIAEGHFERHLRRMRADNEVRRVALLQALSQHLADHATVTGTHAGVHLAVWLRQLAPSTIDTLIAAARERDVGLYSLNPLFYRPPQRAGVLLGYAALSADDIGEGVRRFADALAAFAPARQRSNKRGQTKRR